MAQIELKSETTEGLGTKDEMWDKLREQCKQNKTAALVSINMDNLKLLNANKATKVTEHIGKTLVQYQKQNISVYKLSNTTDHSAKFLMIIENEDQNSSRIIADSIRLQIEKLGAQLFSTTVSMGLAMKNSNDTAEEWYKRANKSETWAQKYGQNCVWDFDTGEPSNNPNSLVKKKSQKTRPRQSTGGDSYTSNTRQSLHSLRGLDEAHENDYKNEYCHLSSLHKFCDTNEPMTLNIGGIKYQTTLTTLLKYKNCLFHKMFEPNSAFSKRPNKDGSYFIDRNGKYFEYILDYLRNGKLNIPNRLDSDSYLINHLINEADFYRIDGLLQELKFLQIGTKLLTPKYLTQIQKWIMEQFPDRKHKLSQWKLLYEWNCDDLTLKNPYNVMHAKCEGISSILIVLLCGNRIFGAYTSVKWKTRDVNDDETFVYWFDNEVIANDIEIEAEESKSYENIKRNDREKKRGNYKHKYKFNYESYREFKSYDSNSENHRCLKFCGGYQDVVVCRYRAAKHQYGHFSMYTNETGYTVTASGPLSLDNSMHLQRMEIFHI